MEKRDSGLNSEIRTQKEKFKTYWRRIPFLSFFV